MSYPRHQLARAFKKVSRTTGDLTVNTPLGTWQELAAETGGPGTGGLDIVLAAQVDDVIEVGMSAIWGNEAVVGYLDVAFIVSAAVAGYVGGAGGAAEAGVPAWRASASVFGPVAGGDLKTVTAPLLTAAGTLQLRPYVRTGTVGNRTLFASADNPFKWWAKNLGPSDPN